jgi:hypothetical protein
MLSLLRVFDSKDSVMPINLSGEAPESSLPICLDVAAVLTRDPDNTYDTKLTFPSRELLRFHSSSNCTSSME